TGLPEDIADKESAVARIEALLAQPEPDRAALASAVDDLDRASSLFAPHERARSSRHRLVDEVRRRFQIPAPNCLQQLAGVVSATRRKWWRKDSSEANPARSATWDSAREGDSSKSLAMATRSRISHSIGP